MATFDDYTKELQKGVKKLAQQLVDGFQEEALTDMNTFLKESGKDLRDGRSCWRRGK
jgi:hypothetical protein